MKEKQGKDIVDTAIFKIIEHSRKKALLEIFFSVPLNELQLIDVARAAEAPPPPPISGDESVWRAIITGKLDLRPFLRVIALAGAMVALAVSGVLYLLAKNEEKRKNFFSVMTYLGSFVSGALFGS